MVRKQPKTTFKDVQTSKGMVRVQKYSFGYVVSSPAAMRELAPGSFNTLADLKAKLA